MENYSLDKGDFENSPLYKKQREERGWDDTELWNLDYTIARFVYPRLKRFIELEPAGWPANDFPTYGEWIEALKKMLYAFEYIVKEDEMVNFVNSEEYSKVQEGLELFGKHFQSLWD